MILLSSNEREKVQSAFGDLSIPIQQNFDILLHTNAGTVGIERKACPGDFISSIQDGRLGRELAAIKAECNVWILLLEGKMVFDAGDGRLIDGRRKSRWTQRSIRGIKRSVMNEGVYIEYSKSILDTVRVVCDIEEYYNKRKHTSLKTRPSLKSEWIMPTNLEKNMYFFQGLPSISAIRAKELAKEFCPFDLCLANPVTIQQIPGIGPKVAMKIYNFLRSRNEGNE